MEPEINVQRQEVLAGCLKTPPDIEKDIYPFKDMKLSRADIEWLLATHEQGRGPVEWNDILQRERQGLDLRGANMSKVDLSNLPLARVRGGLDRRTWPNATQEQRDQAAVLMDGANLQGAHLEGGILCWGYLTGADLTEAHLERAYLRGTYLQGAILNDAQLEGVALNDTHLERASLRRAQLRGADLREAQLQNTDLTRTILEGTDLRGTRFTDEKQVGPRLADVQWGNVNLAVVDWSQMKMLGNEYEARLKRQGESREEEEKKRQRSEYARAARANRQLAVALQAQGLVVVHMRMIARSWL